MPALWKPLVVCIEMNIIYCDVLKLNYPVYRRVFPF